MQNLAGKNSIIGKSIVVQDVTDSENPVTEGCCVIGDAAPPALPAGNPAYAHQHQHAPQYGQHGQGHQGHSTLGHFSYIG